MLTCSFCARLFETYNWHNMLVVVMHFTGCRLLLTEEYKCNNVWKQQLQTPLIQNVDLGQF